MRFIVCIMMCFAVMIRLQSADQQLFMFVHTHPAELGDEEGLNIAYQALTAISQAAAPVLMSENVWQHVVMRKDRFLQGLQKTQSLQQDVVKLQNITNQTLKKNSIDAVNGLLNDAWYAQTFPQLKALDQNVYKHLLFDYFCYDIFNRFSSWKIYQLWGGYLLWIPYNKDFGFDVKQADRVRHAQLSKRIWSVRAADIDQVLRKYMLADKSIRWTFYLTGHGYHKDLDHAYAGVAGIALHSFYKLLRYFDEACNTALFMYSSCYGAGQHSIIPYQDEQGDLLLSYPVIVVSLTDAPAYVFGVPSGLKLPPYNSENLLMSSDVNRQKLQPYFLQNFNQFCTYAKDGKNDIALVKTINRYTQCSFNNCTITKIENLPLIRDAQTAYFVPLDQSQVYCLIKSQGGEVDIKDKVACLLYINSYSGTITISSEVPFFVSMIPGSQVHCIAHLQAEHIDFAHLIRSLFLSIDDIQEQNIYFFDTLSCSILIPEISKEKISQLQEVLVLPSGPWLPSFAQGGASCYVYAQYDNRSYCIGFDQNKQIGFVQELKAEQKVIMKTFKQLLLQQCDFGKNKSTQTLLSSHYFKQRNQLQHDLLKQCLQQKICKG